jgi:hypothetical protein
MHTSESNESIASNKSLVSGNAMQSKYCWANATKEGQDQVKPIIIQ